MIRKAEIKDALKASEILELAMGEFTDMFFHKHGFDEKKEILQKYFAAKNNRLSHENVWIYEERGEIAGAMCAYEGCWSDFLDSLLVANFKVNIKKECEDDEFYIDSIAVSEAYRGRGFFKALMNEAFGVARSLGHHKISLITLTPNLYEQFEFKSVAKQEFYGEIYTKMIKFV